MDLLLLSERDIDDVITMKEVIEADKEALKLYSEGKSTIPLRANLDVAKHEGQSLYMPGYAEDADALGVKIVSVYPKNIEKGLPSVPATMVLLDETTGEVRCLMDGTHLTKLRTGAVAGAATDLLANPDSTIFLLIGTGGQAVTQLEAVLNVRPIRKAYVYDINLERAKSFAEDMQSRFGASFDVQIEATEDLDDITAQADVITAVTTSPRPVFKAEKVKPGAHINGVGSYTPQMQELPPEILDRASAIFLDTRDGVLNESGDFLRPIEAGTFSVENVTGELGELVSGGVKGRVHADDITLFKTTGSAVLDIVVAKKIYDNAAQKGMGKSVTY